MMTSVYLESTWSRRSSILGSIIVIGLSPLLQYMVNLFHRFREVLVHDPVVEAGSLLELPTCGFEPPAHRFFPFGAPAFQPGLEHLPRGRLEEDRDRPGNQVLHLP